MSDTEGMKEAYAERQAWLADHGREQLFVKGQRVCAKTDYQAQWRIGIITDVFLAPVTQQYVYVIGGEGYYADEVTAFVAEAEPQSLRVAP